MRTATLRALLEGVGGEWTDDITRMVRVIDAHLRGSDATTTVAMVRASIEGVLGLDDSAEVTREMSDEISVALAPKTGWRSAKKSGAAAVPRGEATIALNELIARLSDAGLFVVPSGAVESFVKTVGGKGHKWLVDVVAGGHIPRASEAHAFVAKIVSSRGA